ncbi:MAG: flagellar biosynthetic protein FliO [Terracidiphilus sp.]|nr:flagellar biosynthetic protein FliO [Terracidiphilus sp.]
MGEEVKAKMAAVGGLAGWLLARFRAGGRSTPRLAVLERITLAPRQTLALVEAEGRRFLVATSQEGTPAFHALDHPARRAGAAPGVKLAGSQSGARAGRKAARHVAGFGADRNARVSW